MKKKGRVILNRKICDNAPECSGIEVCPTGALYWDEEKERIEYNADICINCGKCAKECPVGAILWGKDDEDYKRKLQEVENDTRRIEELVVERYGAKPIDVPITVGDIGEFIDNSIREIVLLELYSDESIDCLLHSIRIEEIKEWFEDWFDEPVEYKKVHVEEDDDVSIYGIEEYPSILVFNQKRFLGKIYGHYDDDENSKTELKEKLRSIVKK